MKKSHRTKATVRAVKEKPTPVAMVDVSGLLLAKSLADTQLAEARTALAAANQQRLQLEDSLGRSMRQIVELEERSANIEAAQIPQIKEVCSVVVKQLLTDKAAIENTVREMIATRLSSLMDSPQSKDIIEEAVGRAAYKLAVESVKESEKIEIAKEAIIKASVTYFDKWVKENKATFDPKRLLEVNGCYHR